MGLSNLPPILEVFIYFCKLLRSLQTTSAHEICDGVTSGRRIHSSPGLLQTKNTYLFEPAPRSSVGTVIGGFHVDTGRASSLSSSSSSLASSSSSSLFSSSSSASSAPSRNCASH